MLEYLRGLPPSNSGSKLMSTTHCLIEDHVFEQFIDEAIEKWEKKDYNRQKLEGDYIESIKGKNISCNSSK